MKYVFTSLFLAALMAFAFSAEAQENYSSAIKTPRYMNPDRPLYFTIGAGPAFSTGLDSDETMVDLYASVNRNFSEYIAGKLIGDVIMGGGANSARLITGGVGLDFYVKGPTDAMRPYVTIDAGAGFARNGSAETRDAAEFGLGGGFRSSSERANFDLSLQYRVLGAQIRDETPSALSLRVAGNF